MKKSIYKLKENIAEKLDFPRDLVLDMSKITIVGDNEITIENHKGILQFDDKKVKINTSMGIVLINGNGFEILFMGGSTLTIEGRFMSVIYENNE